MRNKWKKLAVAAVAACMVTAVAAAAAGKVTEIIGSASPKDAVSDYGQLDNEMKKAGIDGIAPEHFSNGYTFREAVVANNTAVDEDGNPLERYKDLMIEYEKKDSPDLTLTLTEAKHVHAGGSAPLVKKSIEGIEVSYSKDDYLFLPPDEEPTAEETERERNDDHFFISYGSDRRAESEMSFANFTVDGVHYSLMTTDGVLPADTMFAIAEELIRG